MCSADTGTPRCNNSTNEILVNVNFNMCNSIWFSVPNGSKCKAALLAAGNSLSPVLCQHGLKSAGEEFVGNSKLSGLSEAPTSFKLPSQ